MSEESSPANGITAIWLTDAAACSRCARTLGAPYLAYELEEGPGCFNCAFTELRPPDERLDAGIPAPPGGWTHAPRGAIVWIDECAHCEFCKTGLRTPGLVGLTANGLSCRSCLSFAEPTLACLLHVAYGIREALGHWPGHPRPPQEPPIGWDAWAGLLGPPMPPTKVQARSRMPKKTDKRARSDEKPSPPRWKR